MYAVNFVVTVDTIDSTNSTAVCGTVIVSDVALIYPLYQSVVPCAQPLIGRYVTIKRLNTGPRPVLLALAEVQVFGHALTGNKDVALSQL